MDCTTFEDENTVKRYFFSKCFSNMFFLFIFWPWNVSVASGADMPCTTTKASLFLKIFHPNLLSILLLLCQERYWTQKNIGKMVNYLNIMEGAVLQTKPFPGLFSYLNRRTITMADYFVIWEKPRGNIHNRKKRHCDDKIFLNNLWFNQEDIARGSLDPVLRRIRYSLYVAR